MPKIDNGKILSNENFESLIEESLDTKASEGLIPNSEISEYKKRIEHEINIIKNMGFESLIKYRNQILVIFEANGKNIYPEPKVISFNRSLKKSKLSSF